MSSTTTVSMSVPVPTSPHINRGKHSEGTNYKTEILHIANTAAVRLKGHEMPNAYNTKEEQKGNTQASQRTSQLARKKQMTQKKKTIKGTRTVAKTRTLSHSNLLKIGLLSFGSSLPGSAWVARNDFIFVRLVQ